jgi:hypothetical protein
MGRGARTEFGTKNGEENLLIFFPGNKKKALSDFLPGRAFGWNKRRIRGD